jgi:hypothetical protein
MRTRTPAEFKKWAVDYKPLADAVGAAKAIAQIERARVDAYVMPIFESFQFLDESGTPIRSPHDLYLCDDDATCLSFYNACDAAHRAHGWTGPEGVCPALAAENLLLSAEQALLEAACEFFDIKVWKLHGDKRQEMLTLLLKGCLSTDAQTGTEAQS